MERFGALLFDIWREACRHIELAESVDNIAALLTSHIPLDQLLVLRVDRERACVDTVALGLASERGRGGPARRDWDGNGLRRLLSWCRAGRLMVRRAGEPAKGPAGEVIPPDLTGDVVVLPLKLQGGAAFGILVLHARSSASFTERQLKLCEALMEPFAVALENDGRLRELRALREAAEAEKRSLLTRLGRRELVDEIVGVDGGLRPVMERVELVSRSDVPVLIFGETGSGKEVIARAIHSRSPRAAAPFMRVNCGAIPPGLVDSELFGHEKGSFTGATAMRRGWFERADGGTLFLDEIGELPLEAQVRLLRVVQEGSFERVGGERSLKVDVRIVAATNRDLAASVQNGEFREDLWYRIAVFPIVLPPLRERIADIPALADHFARRAATRFGLRPQQLHPEQIALLCAYRWPGNVRELASVIDRAAILGDGRSLEVGTALGVTVLEENTGAGSTVSPAARAPAAPLATLDDAMRQHIERALAATAGRIEGAGGAAALLDINPHTLRGRMRKLGIDWGRFRRRA